jgi:hypothetical protein
MLTKHDHSADPAASPSLTAGAQLGAGPGVKPKPVNIWRYERGSSLPGPAEGAARHPESAVGEGRGEGPGPAAGEVPPPSLPSFHQLHRFDGAVETLGAEVEEMRGWLAGMQEELESCLATLATRPEGC